jgi:hypothetical protein
MKATIKLIHQNDTGTSLEIHREDGKIRAADFYGENDRSFEVGHIAETLRVLAEKLREWE